VGKKFLILFLSLLFLVFTNISAFSEEPKIMEGHRAPISDFTIAQDGKTLISLDSEGKIKFWSLMSYKVIKEYSIYNAPYFLNIDLSQTKKYIALSADEVLWIYDTKKRKVISKINGVESKGVFIGEEKLLYLRDGFINIMPIYKPSDIKKTRFPYTPPNFIELSPSKKYLALISDDYFIIYDLEDNKILKKKKDKIELFSFIGDTKFIIQTQIGVFLGDIKKKSPKLIKLNIPRSEYLTSSPDGKYVLSSTLKKLYIYEVLKNKLKEKLSQNFDSIQKWIFIDSFRSVFLSIGSNELSVVSTSDLSPIVNLGGYSLPVDKIRFSPSGTFLGIGFRDGDSYYMHVYDLKKCTHIKNELFSCAIDFEFSKTSDKIAILDSDNELFIYNPKEDKVEKFMEDVRERLLLFRKNLIYTFFGYNNLGIYNIKNGNFDSINLNSMPFLYPVVSRKGEIATLGEDGNIWVYTERKCKPKKIVIPSKIKEKLQAEEIGTNIVYIVFTNKEKELIISFPEGESFIMEQIKNFKIIKKQKIKSPIIGEIANGRYLLQEEVSPKTKTVILNILDKNLKKIKTVKMGNALISSYDYTKRILAVGDYGGIVKLVKLKKDEALTMKVFNDGNWIIINNKGEFAAGEGIDKYIDLEKYKLKRCHKEEILRNFFK